MASLFTTKTPEYVGASGAPVASANHGAWSGLFPGAPNYLQLPVTPVPALATCATDSPRPGPVGPGVEVRMAIPGLLTLQGQLTIPPWLPELAPVLAPVLRSMASSLLERALADAGVIREPCTVQGAEQVVER